MHFSFRQKQSDVNGQQFGRRFPLHPPFYPGWTNLAEHISSVKWTDIKPDVLRLGVIAFARFQI